ncbi:hypothetical protein EJ05DRAFT_485407 [Pseudovirgaria hyperparasitica]|uniref:Uncharacterized protein n=1 Tax=Pseudovirgaria hyperparasitica TaxID=470096 RepID=A0A6A6WE39_9PEZI|nr:uncharacterized protein EJ05DRAFT_485407 [Pseudovirgaria hyperparasitica]KAF2759381.1 hypothetical protein EJ05DRAFT_485407 [Pseudovirgaria hyperparasitica]
MHTYYHILHSYSQHLESQFTLPNPTVQLRPHSYNRILPTKYHPRPATTHHPPPIPMIITNISTASHATHGAFGPMFCLPSSQVPSVEDGTIMPCCRYICKERHHCRHASHPYPPSQFQKQYVYTQQSPGARRMDSVSEGWWWWWLCLEVYLAFLCVVGLVCLLNGDDEQRHGVVAIVIVAIEGFMPGG